ncbi:MULTISPECIES: ATP-grasp domain-containing protein [unclassified Halomonas]|uniref:ATP-grasp domain-containing protein n=1 Tax=unclassified Halomonas TaxID=2609666 RepID=UPI0009905D59|nr:MULTISPECIES: hypothetical protein [unclassified Halomonas]AQU81287.1 hypothetical protein B2G49_00845 [Halomonas sp. 'Soap Lake \
MMKYKILLCTPKVLMATGLKDWYEATEGNAILITGTIINEDYLSAAKKIFKEIIQIFNYENSDEVELVADKKCKEYSAEGVIALSEVDVLRAARVRENNGLEGLYSSTAEVYRDKSIMIEYAKSMGIPCPKSSVVSNVIELQDFYNKFSKKLVFKLPFGRGSSGVSVIKNHQDYCNLVRGGPFISQEVNSRFLAQEYIPYDLYRVDGVVIKGDLVLCSTAKYYSSHHNFLNGGALGSIMLMPSDERHLILKELTVKILEKALMYDKNCIFHAEWFMSNKFETYLCEVAIRLGGGVVNEDVKAAYNGFDIKLAYIAACFGNYENWINNQPSPVFKRITGQLGVSPNKGKLIERPKVCGISGLISFFQRGVLGKVYTQMERTNGEVANFLFEGSTEEEVFERLKIAEEWVKSNYLWEEV